MVKHSQYKNDPTQLKNFLGLKLPPFFLHRTELRRSYIDCTLRWDEHASFWSSAMVKIPMGSNSIQLIENDSWLSTTKTEKV